MEVEVQEKKDVFISYSRHDYVDDKDNVIPDNYISMITKALDDNGITYWIDKKGVYSGDEFQELIATAIINSEVLIFVSSEHSNKSKWICKEIAVASYMKKKIIPIKIDEAIYDPSILLTVVGLDFITLYKNPTAGLNQLVKSIQITVKPKVDIQKIKEEICVLQKQGEDLFAQQQRTLNSIISKKKLIGETHQNCPICNQQVEISQSFCPNCGWAFIPFHSSKLDEKRKVLAKKIWINRFATSTPNQTSTTTGLPPCILSLIENMVKVEGGSFMMGATKEQGEDAFGDESPAHKVTLSTYYIGRFPVKQEEWQAVMGNNPSQFEGADKPVDSVNWHECQTFIKKLNEMTGLSFRLPTEAEWEYAARGGKRSKRYKFSGGNILEQVGWFDENSNEMSHPVGQKSPNELGIYDMSGNIWEWVQDWKGEFTMDEQENPQGPENGIERVCRGGGWNRERDRARVSYRGDDDPNLKYCSLGLRIAIDSI